jgi:hypothetical protein
MTPHPSAELFRLINGYQITQAIHVAATLGIADHLKDGARSSDELAALAKAHPATLYRLLRALAAAGVFHEDEGRRFSLTAMGECLRSDSPTPVGGWAAFVGRPYAWQAWGHLLHSVQTGENAFDNLNGESVWQYRAEHPDESAIFDQAMTALSRGGVEAVVKAYDFSRFRHIADIGGGRGQLIAGILAAHPAMRGTLFDQPHVVDKARALLTQAGVNDRCDIVAGSFFESVPAGADGYILRAVIHDWEDQESIVILQACRQAMTAASTLLLVEQIMAPPNEGLIGKFSDLNMLVLPNGRERTRAEFAALFAAADLALVSTAAAGPRFSVIEAKPA